MLPPEPFKDTVFRPTPTNKRGGRTPTAGNARAGIGDGQAAAGPKRQNLMICVWSPVIAAPPAGRRISDCRV
jgi:hypothetical protein